MLLEGQPALTGIWSCERLVWTVVLERVVAVAPSVADRTALPGTLPAATSAAWSWSARPPPRLVRPLHSSELPQSRAHRMILALLSTGERTLADLSALLHLSVKQIALTLDELEAGGWITTEHDDERR